jgi:4a-hydroxytetrahydrobiopterin dehydratase
MRTAPDCRAIPAPASGAEPRGGLAGANLARAMGLLADAEIERRLAGGEWRRQGSAIVRELRFADFAGAIAFVDRVARAAEEANHHPDILVHGWNRVRLTLCTHSQGGLTDSDFRLAAQLDRLA